MSLDGFDGLELLTAHLTSQPEHWQPDRMIGVIKAWQRGLGVSAAFGFALGVWGLAGAIFLWLLSEGLFSLGGGFLRDPIQPEHIADEPFYAAWKWSGVVWVPIASYWAICMLRDNVQKWAAEDAQTEPMRLSQTVHKGLAWVALLIIPCTIGFGLYWGWDLGQWMLAWTGSALATFLAVIAVAATDPNQPKKAGAKANSSQANGSSLPEAIDRGAGDAETLG